ncbi:hypothetical protein CR513_29554, partial [Mucuna pruriens]
MLENIGKLLYIRKTIQQGISLHLEFVEVFYKQKGVSEACDHLTCIIFSFIRKDSLRENKY